MTKTIKKEKRTIPLRTSGESIIRNNERPSKVLFDLAIEAEKEQVSNDTSSSSIPPPTTSYHPLPPPTTKISEISPKRDYTKVANSINRDAVPAGLFKGTSKNTYDVLYQKTRGAINPTRSIKAIQSDLLLWTNLSHNSLRSHLKHLQSIGLIKIHYKLGDNTGALYEVLLPEEINPNTSPYHPLPPPTTSNLNVVGPSTQNLVVGGGGIKPANIEENSSTKTFFKDSNTIDDEAFADFIAKFQSVSEELTGKGITKRDQKNLEKMADLLILELRTAASRTDSISSVPAFLTEVLRRKLLGNNLIGTVKTSKSKTDTVGKPNAAGEYEKKPLYEQGREVALAELQDFASDEFLADFEKWYTVEDWQWLTERLNKLTIPED